MKNSLLIVFFAALFAFTCITETRTFALDIPSAIAGSSDSNSKSDSEDKVTICHFPPGNPMNAQTLEVAESAVSAHVSNHEDTLGACFVCPAGAVSCVGPDGKPGTSGVGIIPGAPSSQRALYGQ